MGTSSPETANKTPEGYPGVFNTVIPYENFYMQIGQNRLKAKDIIGMWRYIHNLFVADLKRLDIIDKFGRLRASTSDTLDRLYAHYNPPRRFLDVLGHEILQQLIQSLDMESVEWTKIYPVDMLFMPIIQDLFAIVHSVTQLQKISSSGDVGPFEFRLAYTKQYSLRIDYDVKSQRNMISMKMTNQYESEVFLEIKSNTRNFDDFINMVDDRIMKYEDRELDKFLNSFTFSFALSKDMSRKRKLLLSITSTEKEE